MDICLNIFERPEVLFAFAALIAIVLLVWVQLWTPKEPERLDKDFNLVCGLTWTYLAILSALVASALKVLAIDQWAIVFIVLSFLMTAYNILMSLLIIVSRIFIGYLSFGRSATEVYKSAPFREKLPWILIWVLALFGLGAISFSITFSSWSCFWIGISLLVLALVVGSVFLCRSLKTRKRVENE